MTTQQASLLTFLFWALGLVSLAIIILLFNGWLEDSRQRDEHGEINE